MVIKRARPNVTRPDCASDGQPSMSGYQLVTFEEGKVCIYGDPEGLRSLSALLQFVADLDQAKLQDNMPDWDSFHCHANPGFRFSLPSLPIQVGRVDNPAGEFRSNVFPKPKKHK